jgi:hypothetical protein
LSSFVWPLTPSRDLGIGADANSGRTNGQSRTRAVAATIASPKEIFFACRISMAFIAVVGVPADNTSRVKPGADRVLLSGRSLRPETSGSARTPTRARGQEAAVNGHGDERWRW